MSHRMNGKVAVVGVGYSPLARDSQRSVGSLALEACREAIRDAGLDKTDIDGVGGIFAADLPTVWPAYVIDGLGLPNVLWSTCAFPPSINAVVEGINAVFSGACKYALCFHAKYRWDSTSASAASDPMRRAPWRIPLDGSLSLPMVTPHGGSHPYAAAMHQHMDAFGSRREHFGMIAINNRTQAQRNPRAVLQEPLTMQDYLDSKEIASPFCVYDMDVPIDGAMAVVVTLADRAVDCARPPVYVEAAANGASSPNDMMLFSDQFHVPYEKIMTALWQRTGLSIADIDVANIYDGFSILTMGWIEAIFSGRGEGAACIEDAWDEVQQQLRFLGRIPMSPHGGNLSEGRLQGFGHLNEAVLQLRGQAGPTQVHGARRALVTNGMNPVCGAMILRSENA
ncbi:MAG: thiolase family protein [Pseudomonadales bacterium]|nr:thiolase family protein [Pseudomonadales bacterium]